MAAGESWWAERISSSHVIIRNNTMKDCDGGIAGILVNIDAKKKRVLESRNELRLKIII